MQMQLDKAALQVLKPVKREIKNLEQTQEVRLTDGMPDVGRVIGAWGQVILRTKEWQQGNAGVNGGVQASVLYAPEEGGPVQLVETWIPFQAKWELPDTDDDGAVNVSCLLRSVDARNTSSRKLLVRVNVGLCGQLWEQEQLWQYTAPQLPEDVCLLKKTHSVNLPRETGEKAFSLEEELTLPGTAPKLEKLLAYHLQPECIEQKILSDKVVFRGVGLVHILYLGEDEQLHTWDFELPFSQYGELRREYEEGTCAKLEMAVTGLEMTPDLEGRLQVKAGLVGQYLIWQPVPLEIVADAYSPYRKVSPAMEEMSLFAITAAQRQTVSAEQVTQIQGMPVDTTFYPDQPYAQQMGGSAELQLPGQFQILYRDEDGQYRTTISRWEGQLPVNEGQTMAGISVTGHPGCATDGTGMTMYADASVDMLTGNWLQIPAVVALEMWDVAEPDPDRPSLILRRAGEDSLWELAKACGSTVAKIMEANHLEGEPEKNRLLLIPVI